jgi:hypothetical protein
MLRDEYRLRVLRWEGHVARIREIRNAFKIVIGKLEGKTRFGMRRRTWEHNIKMDFKEIYQDFFAQGQN